METSDIYSDSYTVMERMIRQGEISGSELEHLLVTLAAQGQISLEEEEALLQLAERSNIDSASAR